MRRSQLVTIFLVSAVLMLVGGLLIDEQATAWLAVIPLALAGWARTRRGP